MRGPLDMYCDVRLEIKEYPVTSQTLPTSYDTRLDFESGPRLGQFRV
jgi:hypothetical protein